MSLLVEFNKNGDYLGYRAAKGLNRKIVTDISQRKNEPGWMTDFRLKALDIFEKKSMPSWGADLSDLDHHDIHYYVQSVQGKHSSWDNVPDDIKATFEKLGIPLSEQKRLSNVAVDAPSRARTTIEKPVVGGLVWRSSLAMARSLLFTRLRVTAPPTDFATTNPTWMLPLAASR